jgi:hypothetical protein
MDTAALYELTQFEPLIDEPWVPAHVEDVIAAIVSDADAAFDREALWRRTNGTCGSRRSR